MQTKQRRCLILVLASVAPFLVFLIKGCTEDSSSFHPLSASGTDACSRRGHRISGVEPYCDCYNGWGGEACTQSLPATTQDSAKVNAAIVFMMDGEDKEYQALVCPVRLFRTW